FTVDKNRPYAQGIEERDDGGALLASYVHGVDLISQHRDGHDYYYHTDEQGSVVTLSDENGAKAANYYYTSYGELWNQGHSFADTNKYRYTGEQFDDETGFYYLRARYYDPSIGRFLTQDNCRGGQGCVDTKRPLSLNKYLYANGNPMLYVDPSGHFGLMEVMYVTTTMGQLSNVAIPSFGGEKGVFDNTFYRNGKHIKVAFDDLMKDYSSTNPCDIMKYDHQCVARVGIPLKIHGLLENYSGTECEAINNYKNNPNWPKKIPVRTWELQLYFLRSGYERYEIPAQHKASMNKEMSKMKGIIFGTKCWPGGSRTHWDLWDGKSGRTENCWANPDSDIWFWPVRQ
ncbi:MAG: hypothetical protein GY847_38510, partial [Proteobacteria bacterium]|nr:hypothetical protein [Pseudomonadota bacterium]